MTQSSELSDVLEPMLREIYDDDDFVSGVIGEAGNGENMQVIIDFIDHARSVGDDIGSDDLLMLAVYLADNGPIRRS